MPRMSRIPGHGLNPTPVVELCAEYPTHFISSMSKFELSKLQVLAGSILFACTYGLGKKIGPMVIDGLDKYTKNIETTMSEGKP